MRSERSTTSWVEIRRRVFGPDRTVWVSSNLVWLRPPRAGAPRRVSSREVWWPRPPRLVGPVTRIVRPVWSGMSAGVQVSLCGMVEAGWSGGRGHRVQHLLPKRWSPRSATARGRAPPPPASRMKDSRSNAAGGWASTVASRSPRPASSTPKAIGSLPVTSSTAGVPAGRLPLAEHEAETLDEVSVGAPPPRCPCRRAARQRDGCPARASRCPEGGCAAEPPRSTGRRRRRPRAGAEASVGGSARARGASAVTARISVMIRVGRVVAPVDHADLGVEPHEAGDVRGFADVGGLLGVAGQDALEVGDVGGAGPHVPAGQVGGGRPLLGGHLLEDGEEVVDRAPPDVDVAGRPFLVVHGATLASGLSRVRGGRRWPASSPRSGRRAPARRAGREQRCASRAPYPSVVNHRMLPAQAPTANHQRRGRLLWRSSRAAARCRGRRAG